MYEYMKQFPVCGRRKSSDGDDNSSQYCLITAIPKLFSAMGYWVRSFMVLALIKCDFCLSKNLQPESSPEEKINIMMKSIWNEESPVQISVLEDCPRGLKMDASGMCREVWYEEYEDYGESNNGEVRK